MAGEHRLAASSGEAGDEIYEDWSVLWRGDGLLRNAARGVSPTAAITFAIIDVAAVCEVVR